jgi:uncharacterized membrane protein
MKRGAFREGGWRSERNWYLLASVRWLGWTPFVLLVIWVGVALFAYGRLPERMPGHFTLTGAPTRWEDTTLVMWLFLPAVAVGLLVLMPLLDRWTEWMNRHYRDSSEASPVRIARLRLRRAYLAVSGGLLVVGLMSLHLGVWLVTVGRTDALPGATIAGALAPFAAMLLLLVPLHLASRGVSIAESSSALSEGARR